MKSVLKPCLILLLSLVCAVSAYCQIGMRITMNRKVYMQYEPVYACITLRNDSGRALLFGHDPKLQGFIYFLIRDTKGRTIAKRPDKEISTAGILLKPGETRNLVIQVNDHYQLDEPGTYSINVCLAHNMLPRELRCKTERTFQIDTGIEIWSAKVGVPDLSENASSKAPAKERKYSIRTLLDPPSKHYYLFVEDDEMVYGVSRIGKEIGIEKFKAEVDMLGRIHLLMPISPRVFHYLTFSLDGVNTASTFWRTSDSIPTIYRDPKNGIVRRVGGTEAKPGLDFVIGSNGVTASKLLNDNAPKAAEGMIDLNKDVANSGRDE